MVNSINHAGLSLGILVIGREMVISMVSLSHFGLIQTYRVI